MSKLGSSIRGSTRGMNTPRADINNIFASSTKQKITAANFNNAQIYADDVDGIIGIQQNGPLSVQNSEKKFNTKNAAIGVEI